MGEEEKKKVKLTVKVLTLDAYIGRIGTSVAGVEKVIAALGLLYTENKVIDRIERKGITYFIAEK